MPQADAFLPSDLRKLCAMFRGIGRDSLLLVALAYNVGCGKVMKSRMYAKIRSGNRNIYRDYVNFKRWSVFVKSNEQNQTCLSPAMARNGACKRTFSASQMNKVRFTSTLPWYENGELNPTERLFLP